VVQRCNGTYGLELASVQCWTGDVYSVPAALERVGDADPDNWAGCVRHGMCFYEAQLGSRVTVDWASVQSAAQSSGKYVEASRCSSGCGRSGLGAH
jgi:hypothetical protein